MTGFLWLDWATLTVSLFNMILLLWLGLTVLLASERSQGGRWGIWLAGGGLLMGAAFFVSHSAMLGRGLHAITAGMNFWWYVGWGPVIAAPFAWYGLMLWYAGFWSGNRDTPLFRRQRVWFVSTAILAASMIVMLLFVFPLPSFAQVAVLDLASVPSIWGVPVLILVYPLYISLCILLSLDALRHPSPSGALMRDLARRRARPWLIASTLTLLAVSLLVAWVMGWIVFNARQRADAGIYTAMAVSLAWFDLVIASLIGVAAVLLGQAIVAYEVFTGTALPRRGFARYWRNAIILAVGYSAVLSATLVIQLRPTYMLLLATLLMTTFYALVSWRSFVERDRTMAHLRPFVAGPRLYDSLLDQTVAQVDLQAVFHALCSDVLGARSAYLFPLGALSPLIGTVLHDPPDAVSPPLSLNELAGRFTSPEQLCLPLDVETNSPYWLHWAVPLWSERGLIGVLLLGDKRDGGPYTQEEIEIARASGERLIDTQATAQVSQRLMALLRQRIAQVRVMEGQGRRILHDEVLPQLHTAILYLGGHDDPASSRAVEALTQAHHRISDLMRDTAAEAPQTLATQGLIMALRTAVERDFADQFSRVEWQIEPVAAQAAAGQPDFVTEVIFFAAQELIRNAARHGRGDQPQRPLTITISLQRSDSLVLTVQDDGIGLDLQAPSSGSRNGLQFHSTMLAAIGGSLSVDVAPGGGTRATIMFPPALAFD